MNYTFQNDTITIIQDSESQKPNKTYELGEIVALVDSIRREVVEYTNIFDTGLVLDALNRLNDYKEMYEVASTRLAELEIERREQERIEREQQELEASEIE